MLTIALAAMTLAAAAGFGRVFRDPSWIVPMLVVAVGVHLVCWATRRLGWPGLAAAVIGVAAVVLLTAWTVVPGSLTAGLPLGHTWHVVSTSLREARRDFPTVLAPTDATTGFRLLAACGVGVVAVSADWLTFRWRGGLRAATPAFALFLACCIFGATSGRLPAVLLILVTILAFWLVQRAAVGDDGVVWFANRSGSLSGAAAAVGAGAAGAALLAALVVTPALPHTEGQGLLGWHHGIGGTGGNRSVPSPIADLQTRLLQDDLLPVFTVASPVPSYWRLTSLDTFTGAQWQSTDSYTGTSGRLPGQPTLPAREVTAQFHIQNLDSIWMPTAFNPTAVAGGGHVSWDPVSSSLLAAKSTSNGLAYRLTSYQYLATLDPTQLNAAGAAPAGLPTYLTLPSSVPARVRRLAASIVAAAHAQTEYQKAIALQDYFQGPQFHYSLRPISDGSGNAALSTFLFDTQTGYCQQFAGAYAVLARAVGLPTRLAVGFATGLRDSQGVYHVTDSDAHTWPEVYFRQLGWLPFEPTKGGGFQIPGTSAYTGNTTGNDSGPAATTQTTLPTSSTTPSPVGSIHKPVPAGSQSTPAAAVHHHHASAAVALLVLGCAAAALLAWIGVNIVVRRVRWAGRRQRATGPRRHRAPGRGRQGQPGDQAVGAAHILVGWAETAELLGWWQIWRHGDETLVEFAERATAQLRLLLGRGLVDESLHHLATCVTGASYDPDDASPAQVAAADQAARRVATVLAGAAPRTMRLRRLLDPRLAWSPAHVDPTGTWTGAEVDANAVTWTR